MAVIALAVSVQANSLELNLYGVSYHLIKEGRSREYLNEFNTGFGIRAVTGSDSSGWMFLEGGKFRDTFENEAIYGSIGFLARVYGQFRIGLNLAAYKSESVTTSVVAAPIPMAAYSLWRLTLNVAYLPKYQGRNPYHTFGAYLSIRPINLKPRQKT